MSEQTRKTGAPLKSTLWIFILVLVVGNSATLLFFWLAKNSTLDDLQRQFNHDSTLRANIVSAKLRECLLVVEALHSTFDGTNEVKRNEFKVFATPFLAERKELQLVGWLPRVLKNERSAFEESRRREGLAGFSIHDFETEDRLVTAGDREEYFPVDYIEPLKGNEDKFGINVASQPLRGAALERARDTGLATVSAPIRIYQKESRPGFAIYIPNYRKDMPIETVEQRRGALLGFTMGIYRTADVVEKVMGLVSPEGLPYDLIDVKAPADRQLFYRWDSRLLMKSTWRTMLLPESPHYVRKLDFGGREWEMRISASPAYLLNNYNLDYWLILPAGIGLTLIFYLYLRTVYSQHALLERLVYDRTVELQQYKVNLEGLVAERSTEIRHANQRLKMEVVVRKQAEELLQKSENQLRLLLDSTAEAIYGIDLNGKCTFCNIACLHMLGYKSQNELLGKNMHWLIHHSYKDGTTFPVEECRIFQAFQTGKGTHVDDEVIWRADGTCFPAEYWSFPQRAGNAIVGSVVTFMDITYRKRAEEALRASEERVRSIYECSSDAILLCTEEGFFDCNTAAAKMFGFASNEELARRRPSDVSPPFQPNGEDSLSASRRQVQIAYAKGVNFFEWTHRRNTGEDFPAEVLLSSFNYGGKQALQATVRDITKRKETEAELRKLSIAVEQNPATIVITDREGNIKYTNLKFCEITGYSRAEVYGKNPRILKSGNKTPEEYENLWNTIKSGQVWRGEFLNRKKNGEYYWEEAWISPILDEQGNITNFIAIKEDITQRKKDEESLKKALDDLANTNADLIRANHIKSLFLATMSHEIRTPLNAIIGMTGLLMDTKLDFEQQDCVETARKSGEMLLDLINNILDFSKIEAEKIDFEYQPFDLRRAVEDSLELVIPKAREKKLKFTFQMDAGLPPMFVGDVTRLRQILVNLLSNAVKFTDQGEITTVVAGMPCDNDRYQLLFEVRDTGLGIPPDRQERLFQSFTQIDASTNRRFGGTGLGLAISKRLTEMMGGRMWAESRGIPGEGSIFHFTILAEPASEQSGKNAPRGNATHVISDISRSAVEEIASESTASPDKTTTLRILLADDNLVNQKVALKMLEKSGYRADVVSNGLEAFEAARQIPYDVILMDCQMPELDGYEATRRIRILEQAEHREPMRIIAMTAHALKGDREKCLEAGMNDYLSKPVREIDLRRVLERCRPLGTSKMGDVRIESSFVELKNPITAAIEGASSASPSPLRAADAPGGEPLLNTETLKDMVELGLDGFAELIELYHIQTKELLSDLHVAVSTSMANDIKRIAHKLVGSSVACGIKAAIAPLRELEDNGREGKLENAEKLYMQIEQLMKSSEKALDAFIYESHKKARTF